MKLRNGLVTFGSLVLLLLTVGCAAPVEPVATVPASVPENVVEAAPNSDAESPSVVPPAEEEPSTQLEQVAAAVAVAPVVLEATLDGDTVIIPLAAVEDVVNAGFSVTLEDRLLDFMAYELDGEVFVRASACPPCRSRAFALDDEALVCETCATRFDAWTGQGVVGACVDYPKARVACTLSGDGLVLMAASDLVRAYDETLIAGSDPLEEEVAVAEEPEVVDTRPACCR